MRRGEGGRGGWGAGPGDDIGTFNRIIFQTPPFWRSTVPAAESAPNTRQEQQSALNLSGSP